MNFANNLIIKTTYISNFKILSKTQKKFNFEKCVVSKLIYILFLTKNIFYTFSPKININILRIKKKQITFLKSPNRHKKFQTHLILNFYKIIITYDLKLRLSLINNFKKNIFKLSKIFNFNSIFLKHIKSIVLQTCHLYNLWNLIDLEKIKYKKKKKKKKKLKKKKRWLKKLKRIVKRYKNKYK